MPIEQEFKVATDLSQIVEGVGTPGTQAGGVVTVQGDPNGTPAPVSEQAYIGNSYSPDPSNVETLTTNQPLYDASDRLETHSAVTSDEGSFRDDFSGAALTTTLTGTLGFTNGSENVTGVGTAFTTQVKQYQYIKKSADPEADYVQVASVNSDTSITLASNYLGTTATGQTGVSSKWATNTGSGGSFSVANSLVNILSGITSGAQTYIMTPGDYLPYTLRFYSSISQRIANQNATLGFFDQFISPNKGAYIQFTGTNNTQVNFITSSSNAATDIQTTTVTLPAGALTSAFNLYQIDLSANQATLSINGIVVAVNTIHLPGPYDNLLIAQGWNNSGVPASTSTLTTDFCYFSNWDRVQIDNDFNGEPLKINTQDAFGAGSISAVAGVVLAMTNGQSSLVFNVQGTFVGTMICEAIDTEGSVWNAIQGLITVNNVITSFVGGNTLMIVNCGGFNLVRLRATAWTSGTATVTWEAGSGNNIGQVYSLVAANFQAQIQGNTAAGAADTGNGVKSAGVFNTTVPALTGGWRGDIQLDARSAQQMTQLDGCRATYSVTMTNLVPAATPTDVFTITGSATKTVRIFKIRVSGTQTTGSVINVVLLKRSTANSAGTSTAGVLVPHDSNSAAATATALGYTANPTTGTLVGNIRAIKAYVPTLTSSTPEEVVWQFGDLPVQGLVLRGIAQVLAINLAGATIAGGSFDVSVELTEE
jgi:hypothetical protein